MVAAVDDGNFLTGNGNVFVVEYLRNDGGVIAEWESGTVKRAIPKAAQLYAARFHEDRFPRNHEIMTCSNEMLLEGWRRAGFSEEEACAWIAARAEVRFTPAVALEWRREGFGPIDAAM